MDVCVCIVLKFFFSLLLVYCGANILLNNIILYAFCIVISYIVMFSMFMTFAGAMLKGFSDKE
jgi:hypothetical protein